MTGLAIVAAVVTVLLVIWGVCWVSGNCARAEERYAEMERMREEAIHHV